MARLKTFGATRKPDASGSVKAPRKSGPGMAPKGILKKTAPKAVASAIVVAPKTSQQQKKKKQQQQQRAAPAAVEAGGAVAKKKKKQPVQEHESEAEEEAPAMVEDEAEEDDEAVSTDDGEEELAAAGAGVPTKPRKINHALRRLKRMKTLQKSEARLCTEAGFKRLVRYILGNSRTAAIGLDSVRFTRAALQNLQAAVESLMQLILTDTAHQVYTITGRNARVSAAPIAVTAEQRLRGMCGAQFINDYRDVCNM